MTTTRRAFLGTGLALAALPAVAQALPRLTEDAIDNFLVTLARQGASYDRRMVDQSPSLLKAMVEKGYLRTIKFADLTFYDLQPLGLRRGHFVIARRQGREASLLMGRVYDLIDARRTFKAPTDHDNNIISRITTELTQPTLYANRTLLTEELAARGNWRAHYMAQGFLVPAYFGAKSGVIGLEATEKLRRLHTPSIHAAMYQGDYNYDQPKDWVVTSRKARSILNAETLG